MKYYAKAENLKLDIENGDIDVAYRSLTPTDIDDLEEGRRRQGLHRRRRRAALHRVQPQDDARRQRRAEAGDPQGDGLLGRPRGAVDRGLQGARSRRRTRWSRRAQVGATEAFKDAVRRRARQGEGREVPRATPASRPRSRSSCSTTPTTTARAPTRSTTRSSVSSRTTGLFKVDLQSTEWTTYSGGVEGRRLPGVPARLVPGLPGRRQLPVAVPRSVRHEEGRQLHQLALQRRTTRSGRPDDDEAARRAAHRGRRGLARGEARRRSRTGSPSRCPSCRC